ncbi:MAG: hypothetical protein JWN07_2435 [Hyphomicrobiales bacterium]|nr:hypothetical protein [Hyphomicrobiales bacterium]
MRMILAATALLAASIAPAAAQYRAVSVDASAIAAQGYPTFARRVEAAVTPGIASAFAGQINPGDPRGLTLVVRILAVNLPTTTGLGRESENDYMLSEGVVVDQRGRVVASASVPSNVTAWTTVASLPIEIEEQRRMRQLGLHAGGWLRNRLSSGS